jgi:hypothetical protein
MESQLPSNISEQLIFSYHNVKLTLNYLIIGDYSFKTSQIKNVSEVNTVNNNKRYWAITLIILGVVTSIFIIGFIFLFIGLLLYSKVKKYFLKIEFFNDPDFYLETSSRKISKRIIFNINNVLVQQSSVVIPDTFCEFPVDFPSESTQSSIFIFRLNLLDLKSVTPPPQKNTYISIIEWLKEDGDYVNNKEPLFTYKFSNSYSKFSGKEIELLTMFSVKSGYLHVLHSTSHFEHGDTIYKIFENEELRLNSLFINVPNIIQSPISKEKTIKWSKVSSIYNSLGISSYSIDRSFTFTFTLNFIELKDQILFQFNPKYLQLSKGDVVSFKFANGYILNFYISSNSYKPFNPQLTNILENKSPILQKELDTFQNNDFLGWSIFIASDSFLIEGGFEGVFPYSSHKNLVAVIKKFTADYRIVIRSEVPDYTEINLHSASPAKDTIIEEYCFVYLMVDTTNGYHKIGISNSPFYREKTLQSEKPTIELITSKKFPSRIIAESIEKALHESFKTKRIRGEWFSLDSSEVSQIINTLC